MDSFFDIFIEISIDAEHNWIPSNGPTRFSIADTPEPSTVGLALLGLLGCGWLVLHSHPARGVGFPVKHLLQSKGWLFTRGRLTTPTS